MKRIKVVLLVAETFSHPPGRRVMVNMCYQAPVTIVIVKHVPIIGILVKDLGEDRLRIPLRRERNNLKSMKSSHIVNLDAFLGKYQKILCRPDLYGPPTVNMGGVSVQTMVADRAAEHIQKKFFEIRMIL